MPSARGLTGKGSDAALFAPTAIATGASTEAPSVAGSGMGSVTSGVCPESEAFHSVRNVDREGEWHYNRSRSYGPLQLPRAFRNELRTPAMSPPMVPQRVEAHVAGRHERGAGADPRFKAKAVPCSTARTHERLRQPVFCCTTAILDHEV